MAKGGSGLVASDWNARRSSLNNGAPWPTPEAAAERVLEIQRKLHKWSTDDQDRRFCDLHNLVCDPDTLMVAWARVRASRGSRSAGVDGQSARHIEQVLGVQRFLDGLREELRSGSFRPLPVKERRIPKRGGKFCKLGIPTIRDRVVQAALKLVLEPIFEADVQPCSYGFRPGRRAQDAIAEIHFLSPALISGSSRPTSRRVSTSSSTRPSSVACVGASRTSASSGSSRRSSRPGSWMSGAALRPRSPALLRAGFSRP